MEVDVNLEAVLGCPVKRLLKVRNLAIDVGLSGTRLKRPVTDGQTDVREAALQVSSRTSAFGGDPRTQLRQSA